MYSTKNLNKNIIKESYTTIGDPYSGKPRPLPDRFKGKQLQTKPSLNTSGGVGFFSKKSYETDGPILDTTNYKKTQPQDNRKKGFGSNDASRRDEFTNTISTEQYREGLKREVKLEQSNLSDSITLLETQLGGKKPAKKKHLYDIGRKQETEFNPKSHRDTFYHRDQEGRDVGPYNLSSANVGEGTSDPSAVSKPMYGHVKKTKEFFDKSHLST